MVAYPVLSVYPIIFRTFIFHRYTALLRTPRARVIGSAATFAFAHIVLHNAFAIAATAVVGVALATVYERDRSTLGVAIEHALWGCLTFTLGLGAFFYAGAR